MLDERKWQHPTNFTNRAHIRNIYVDTFGTMYNDRKVVTPRNTLFPNIICRFCLLLCPVFKNHLLCSSCFVRERTFFFFCRLLCVRREKESEYEWHGTNHEVCGLRICLVCEYCKYWCDVWYRKFYSILLKSREFYEERIWSASAWNNFTQPTHSFLFANQVFDFVLREYISSLSFVSLSMCLC